MKLSKLTFSMMLAACCQLSLPLQAQDAVTNAFDDLKRQGTVNEQDSEMRHRASADAVRRLVAAHASQPFMCFPEDRLHDIRLSDGLPQRWLTSEGVDHNGFAATCAPNEFYTWQIGVFASKQALHNVTVRFYDLKNERGQRIKASALRCFNTGGRGADGQPVNKSLSVGKDSVQALWIGADIPADAHGTYRGKIRIAAEKASHVDVAVALTVEGQPLAHHGDDEGWCKSRLRWLDSEIGTAEAPTRPYTALQRSDNTLTWLGGELTLADNGLPADIVTHYDQGNQLAMDRRNRILADELRLVVETSEGTEVLTPGQLRFTSETEASVAWTTRWRSKHFSISCNGTLGFDGRLCYRLAVTSTTEIQVRDIRLEVPYTTYAATYMMGLGRKGGLRPAETFNWQWDVAKHQDKVWMGNVNAGLNLVFKDEHYVRPLVNIYYALGRLQMPYSWGNDGKGGVTIADKADGKSVCLTAYSGQRAMKKKQTLHFDFDMLVTPVKPYDLKSVATERFYHSNSDLSRNYIAEAKKAGATHINVHHKKDIYPFINYPYYDESVPDLRRFINEAHHEGLGVRLYYTTRELTVKLPELWALRSLGSEVIHDGPGKDTRTLIHRNGPNEWLNRNLTTHFIPAWYNAFNEGKYAGDMDISVITTPDSRWNNYYLEGLDWMVKNLGVDGIYIDDSALDHQTLQRARRILDADGQRRIVDLHSWNHMNQWAGYANSLHLYMELLPYVDRVWMGEGFGANNTPDFWLVEMSGIPFGIPSETLDARNVFRGMTFGMLPRLPWSGNPVPLWKIWDDFGMADAAMHGYWESEPAITTDCPSVKATVFLRDRRALLVLANWSDQPQTVRLQMQPGILGFAPRQMVAPAIDKIQSGKSLSVTAPIELGANGGAILLLE